MGLELKKLENTRVAVWKIHSTRLPRRLCLAFQRRTTEVETLPSRGTSSDQLVSQKDGDVFIVYA